MDVREKLVELIGSTKYGIENRSTVKVNFQRGFIEKIADHLIAHGVTVQEWISVKDRLPEANQRVLTVDDSGYVVVNCISSRFDGWFSNAFDQKRVTHWMPLPQPPKGE